MKYIVIVAPVDEKIFYVDAINEEDARMKAYEQWQPDFNVYTAVPIEDKCV